MDINSLLSPADTPTSTPSPRIPPASYDRQAPTSAPRDSSTGNHRSMPANNLGVPAEKYGITSTSMSPPSRPSASKRAASSMDTLADLASMQHPQPDPRSRSTPKKTHTGHEKQIPIKPIRPSLEAISRAHSGSRSSLDIHMEEMPTRVPRSRTFQSTSLSAADLQMVQQLTSYLAEHPYAYESHLELIRILHQGFLSHTYSTETSPDEHDPITYDLLPELRQAREAMASRFTMGEQAWLERIQDEMLLARSLEDCLQVVEHCEKAVVEEVGSTKLWAMFGSWELALYSAANPDDQDIAQLHDGLNEWIRLSQDDLMVAAEVFGLAHITDVWKRGAEDTKFNINDSHLVWDKYTELLRLQLGSRPSQESIQVLRQHFIDRLLQPHHGWDNTFQLFSSFISTWDNSSYEETMAKTNRSAARAKHMFSDREMLEIKLARALETGDQSAAWAVMVEYLEWETSLPRRKAGAAFSFDIANALYQRATLLFPSDTNIWEDHLVLLGEENEHRQERISTLPLLGRACGHCPWSGKLWSLYIQAAERQQLSFPDIGQIKHKATSTGLLDSTNMEDILAIHTTWCSFLRRRAFSAQATDEEADVAEVGIRSAIEDMESMGQQKHGKDYNGDPQYRLERIYIKFLAQSRQFDLARSVWQKLVPRRGNLCEFWVRWYTWEIHCWSWELGKTGTSSQQLGPVNATKVLLQAAKMAVDMDEPEKILDTYLVHCQDHEDVATIEGAIVVWRKAMKHVVKRREQEAAEYAAQQEEAKMQAQSMAEEAEEADVSPSTGHNIKRKREDDLESENQETKRPKGSPAPEHQAHSTQTQPKRDRENNTVIVRDLPSDTPENWIQHYFKDCGQILSILLAPDKDGESCIATVEFETKEDALSALTKDGKSFHDHTIRVIPGTGTTLYVTNFPPEADGAWIRDLFQSYGEIVDVRFPSLKYDAHRRFCYVQFTSIDGAKAATALDDSNVDGGLKLVAKFSDPSRKEKRSGAIYEGREVHVRNVDWKATEHDLEALFKPFGTVERVRIPRNSNGKSKGFAFVTFSSKDEAESSLSLTDTKFNSRIITVTIAEPNPGKHSTTVVSEHASHKSASPAIANGDTESPSTQPSTAQSSDRSSRTIALANIPDTISTSRLQALLSPHGTIEQITLRPDHQGAIILFADAASAGKAALSITGHEIAPGRYITTGPVSELFKHEAEAKDAHPGVKKNTKSTSKVSANLVPIGSGPIRRPAAAGSGRRGGLGLRRGPALEKGLGQGGTNDEGQSGKSNQAFRDLLARGKDGVSGNASINTDEKGDVE